MIIAVYLFVVFVVVKRVKANKEAENALQFATGSRTYLAFLLFPSITATMIGPGYSIGVGEKAYTYGFFFIAFYFLAMIQMLLFGFFFAKGLHRIGYDSVSRTMGDIFCDHYGRSAKMVIGLITLVQSMAIAGVVSLGGGRVLNYFWGIPVEQGIILTSVVVASYCIVGGFAAVIKTDAFQFWVMTLAGLVILISGVYQLYNAQVKIEADWFWNNNSPRLSTAEIVSIGVSFLLGEAFIPVYSTRAFVSKDAEIVKRAFIYTGLYGIVWFSILTIGGIAGHLVPADLVLGKMPFMAVIERTFSNPLFLAIVLGIMGAGFLSIVMSTLASILNAGAVSAVRDFLGSIFSISEEQEFRYTKALLLIIALGGVVFTAGMPNIIDILLIAYQIWVPTIVFPFAYLVYSERKPCGRNSFIWSVVAGIIGFGIARLWGSPYVPDVLLGLLLNAMTFMVLENRGQSKTA
jgi:SSS family solute:Na+ symporter